MATACGYTVGQIDEMTMADFDMLATYWRDHPPPHLMMAGYLRIKPKRKTNTASADELRDLFSGPGWTVH